jgi:hypothetical protein
VSSEVKAVLGLAVVVLTMFILIVCISGSQGLLFVLEVTSGLLAFFVLIIIYEYARRK